MPEQNTVISKHFIATNDIELGGVAKSAWPSIGLLKVILESVNFQFYIDSLVSKNYKIYLINNGLPGIGVFSVVLPDATLFPDLIFTLARGKVDSVNDCESVFIGTVGGLVENLDGFIVQSVEFTAGLMLTYQSDGLDWLLIMRGLKN